MPDNLTGYIGRFAPSPTGPLHFGSLISAAASYLDARAHQGNWLVRIEDIDPPREQPGSADIILAQLEAHGLFWDKKVLYQSKRHQAYQDALTLLKEQQRIYPCSCTRQDLKQRQGNHGGTCSNKHNASGECAWRVSIGTESNITFEDCFAGHYQQDLAKQGGDFILLRKDGLFAYQLAVSIDDAYQNITHIIRGNDLLDSTPRQVFLQQLLNFPTPVYGHLPIAVNSKGGKLSKQNHAPPLKQRAAEKNLSDALQWLRLPLPKELVSAPCIEQLNWAQQNWSRQRLVGLSSLPAPGEYC